MRRNCFVILVLCMSIFLSGCNIIEESTTQSDSSSITTESTESSDGSLDSNTSSEATTSISSETESSITCESVSIPEGLSREEMYWDVGQTLLLVWSMYYYFDDENHIYLREYQEFDEIMMLEMLYTSDLIHALDIDNRVSSRLFLFDYCHREEDENQLLYLVQAMHFLFGQDTSAEEIMELVPGTSDDLYVMRYDESYASLQYEFCDMSEIEVVVSDEVLEASPLSLDSVDSVIIEDKSLGVVLSSIVLHPESKIDTHIIRTVGKARIFKALLVLFSSITITSFIKSICN